MLELHVEQERPLTDDELLVQRVHCGDRDAFKELHLLYGNYVNSVLWSFGGQYDDDLSQEIFVRLWSNPPVPPLQNGNLKAWLHRVTKNAFLSAVRAKKRRDMLPSAPLDEWFDGISLTEQDPLEAACRREGIVLVDKAIRELGETTRSALIMFYFDDMLLRDIAAKQQSPINTVKRRLHRGRLQLRAALSASVE